MMSRLLDRGFTIVADDSTITTEERVRALYAKHQGKPFFEGTIQYMTSEKCRAMILHRRSIQETPATQILRDMIGATSPDKSAPGTIRGDYGCQTVDGENLIHGSRGEDLLREIELFFPDFLDCIKDVVESK